MFGKETIQQHDNSLKNLMREIYNLAQIQNSAFDLQNKRMDCKYVRQSSCICYKFHPLGSSIFLLTHFKNRLRIVQQNLLTGLVMNEFIVPLKQQNLEVENYILNFCQQLKVIILTLYNHVLIYSLDRKTLVFVGQVHGKNPYYIEKALVYKKSLLFTAADQHNIYTINIQKMLLTNKIDAYGKYKIAQQATIVDFVVANKKLIGLSSDKSIKVWDVDSYNSLKGVSLPEYGKFVCMALSKNDEFLLCGTSEGYVLGFDAKRMGQDTIMILKQRIVKTEIRSLSWFHYSGQDQSKRFLAMTSEGSVKLFSFFFESDKNGRMIGKANDLALLYELKSQQSPQQLTISSHPFANFIFFHPGVLLFMVDNYPRIYYPVIARQLTYSFDDYVPNHRKQIFFQRDFLFIQGLHVKRLLNDIESRVDLSSVLDYENLKVIKFDYRPMTTELVPKSKILINYYLKNTFRTIVMSNINLSVMTDNVETLNDDLSISSTFLGPVTSQYPLILNLQNDRHTISIVQQDAIPEQTLKKCDPQQRPHLSHGPRIISSTKLPIKVQKVFQTPFRNNYVVLYLSQNLLRFSKNIDCQNDILNYEVYSDLSLRLEYYDIILDVLWTKGAEFAAVVCLDKIVFISPELKVIRVVNMEYIVQAQWIGYTLIVTTKVDVQYVDIVTKPVQLYCIQNFESKYLILAILGDRILSIQRFENSYSCKSRYFNIMEPLLSGYLAFHKLNDTPIDATKCKRIIQCFAPYHIVSESFLKLLNEMKLSSFSKYFIENNMKLYSKSIRANTMNSSLKMERFIDPKIWNRSKKQILELFLAFEETSDTTDPFEKQKNEHYKQRLISLISEFSFKSITQAMKEQRKKGGITIATNFGQKGLTQVYWDIKQDEKVPMEIQPFKAENIGEWIGLFSGYIQAKIGAIDGGLAVVQEDTKQQKEEEQEDKPFKDLVVYYRFDQGKGQTVEDLGDYGNNADVFGEWNALEDEPMELQDKWGKKCPPQFSISGYVARDKKLTCRKFQSFTIETWFKFTKETFSLYNFNEGFHLTFTANHFHLNNKPLPYNGEIQPIPNMWNHITSLYNHHEKLFQILINTQLSISLTIPIHATKNPPIIGDSESMIQFTEFKYWKRVLDVDEIKDTLRSPLELVHEKRKKLKMKIKKKKKEEPNQEADSNAANFFSFDL